MRISWTSVGKSTRPGAEPLGIEDECRRVLPVIEGLAKRARVPLSIDTRNAEVMRRAAQSGARIINDVSALAHDPQSLEVAAASGLPVVLMHALGEPRTMQRNPVYDDVVLDVYDALEVRIEACEKAGIARERLIVDPGIGFGKTLAHNLALLGALSIFHGLGCTVLLGASRKSFIGRLTGALADDRQARSQPRCSGRSRAFKLFGCMTLPPPARLLPCGRHLASRDREVYRIGEPGRAVEASRLTSLPQA